MNRDAEAARWCREGLRRFPANPVHAACVLEVMAWGAGPAHADTAWAYYRELERLTAVSNATARAFYTADVAAVLARSRAVSRDSARAVLARVQRDVANNQSLREQLLPTEAAVLYRLGDSTRANELFSQLRQRDPRRASLVAQRRMLRDYVGSTVVPNNR
jgi:hypothetical protein